MAQLSVNNPCGSPPADRCASPIFPLFNTGISNRQVPLCDSGPFCDCERPSVARYHITREGTLDRSHWIEGWVIGQLITRGEVTCDEHPLKQRAGGWWADAFRADDSAFKSGSKLWSMQWAFVTNESLILAKQYARQALQYLVAWGIASAIKIETTYVSQKSMRLNITVTGPGILTQTIMVDGQPMPNSEWMWQEYKAGG